jgi:hypothetical protein
MNEQVAPDEKGAAYGLSELNVGLELFSLEVKASVSLATKEDGYVASMSSEKEPERHICVWGKTRNEVLKEVVRFYLAIEAQRTANAPSLCQDASQ